ncbi:MAG TPA: M23 family peptidase [Bacteroidetes bacterium]|nr:M23 family peptidase [Bacteroidota bacterium]
MSSNKKKKKPEDLRLVIMNENTFEEKYSFKLNVKNIYFALSAIIIVLFILMFSLISFTPLKHLVPGYANIENNSYVIKLNRYINNLEEKVKTQDQYNQSLRKILIGDDSIAVNNVEMDKNVIKSKPFKSKPKGELSQNLHLSPPLIGKMNKKFDAKTSHYGIDIAGVVGTPVKSVLDGIVVFSDWSTETGNTVIVQHPNGLVSVYKHNSTLFKEVGDFVKKGEVLAKLGNSGRLTSGPHLHFELWYNGIPLDAQKYIDMK